ncbi:MAG: hypothetical protein HDR77_07690 [Bacteroides sp.]|nr:hypothetical protein [Bacteroides sp.]
MTKQLVITCSTQAVELEVKDFLNFSKHSPEWFGNLDNWEIKSINVGDKKMTALLENKNWSKPIEQFFETECITAILNEETSLRRIYFIKRKGYSGKVVETQMGKSVSFNLIDDIRFGKFAVINSTGEGYYNDGSEILGTAIKEGKVKSLFDYENKGFGDSGYNLAVRIDDATHPICGHYVENHNLYLIYDQDISLINVSDNSIKR